jgi:ubiquinone/menaquinone biosynthesis C-methylase UbiE
MKSRGERKFTHLSPLGASNYQRLMGGVVVGAQYAIFARDCAARVKGGRLLDVGTGPGQMLRELHQMAPGIGLYGLDISPAMVDLARRNLEDTGADLRLGSIAHTEYDSGFFEAVTCTKSFYLWDDPVACLSEVHRILKPGGAAYLYESVRDYDPALLALQLEKGLAPEKPLRRMLARWALRNQLRETYSRAEIQEITGKSPFRGACSIDTFDAQLRVLCVWVRVTMRKAA